MSDKLLDIACAAISHSLNYEREQEERKTFVKRFNERLNRTDWLSACALARARGRISPTLANLVAAYRSLPMPLFPPDPFA
jgi:hypothetical protein